MKGLLALLFGSLAVGCASSPPLETINISRPQEQAAVLDVRAASKLHSQLDWCGSNQECRADRIARYHARIAPLPGSVQGNM